MKAVDVIPLLIVGACIAASIFLPALATPAWVAGGAAIVLLLHREIRKPVNYESLEFDATGFRFKALHGGAALSWQEIADVYYCRGIEPFTGEMETEWEFHSREGRPVMVLVEWPQAKAFARAVASHLSGISREEVEKLLRRRGEGRWQCRGGEPVQ